MKIKKNRIGRPPGKKKTSKIEVSIEPEIKSQFMGYLKSEQKCASIQIREWILDYIKHK
ncbi:hypothetical protein I7V34_21005 [Bacillus sp. V3]|nr:hypothetical protein I7V34_21005 [Bacillus sp. V3]